jgi:hypothetical protein
MRWSVRVNPSGQMYRLMADADADEIEAWISEEFTEGRAVGLVYEMVDAPNVAGRVLLNPRVVESVEFVQFPD